jgi:hypothetical protein
METAAAQGAIRVPREIRVRKEIQDLKVSLARQARKAFRVQLGPKARKAFRVQLGPKARKVFRA